MADHYQHEPAESDAGVHVAQQFVAFPQLYMEETVTEPVPYVLGHDFRVDKTGRMSFCLLMKAGESHAVLLLCTM